MMERIYNFNAGPAMLPTEVLKEVQSELLNMGNSGMSILEMSHRAPIYEKINDEAQRDMKDLLGLGDDYCVMFMGGGASLQFSMVAMNFLEKGKTAAYFNTGSFSDKAIKEAKRVGNVVVPFSSKEDGYNRVPKANELILPEDCAYLHITGNNTIEGTEYHEYPETGNVPLIADMSSDILSRPFAADKFSMIYGGVQKNIGPAGAVFIIARKNFIEGRSAELHSMLNYEIHLKNNSLYNTPPVFAVYIVGKVAKWIKNLGGLSVLETMNKRKAKMIYDVIDAHNDFYRGFAEKDSRSLMNVTFGLPNDELTAKFAKEAEQYDLFGLKGHRSVGGIRASIYNAMPEAGCVRLAEYMEDFWKKNK